MQHRGMGLIMSCKNAYLIVVLCLIANTVSYAGDVTEAWAVYYDTPWSDHDFGKDIVSDVVGNVYIIGDSDNATTGQDILTLKYSPDGTELWSMRYSGPGDGYDDPQAVDMDPDGNVYVIGSTTNSSGIDVFTTLSYSPDGTERWVARFENQYDSIAKDIAVDQAGNIYVTGISATDSSYNDIVTVKYNNDGSELWSQRFDGPESLPDEGRHIALDAEGNVYTLGRIMSMTGGENCDWVLIKYNGDGVLLWSQIYGEPGADHWDQVNGLAVDNAGCPVVAGTYFDTSAYYSCVIVKYNSDGVQLWDATCVVGTSSRPQGIALDSSGDIYIAGSSYTAATKSDCLVIKYSSDGQQQWIREYNGPGDHYDYINDIAVDEYDNVFVTGDCNASAGDRDFVTICYNTAGDQEWIALHDAPGDWNDDVSKSITLDQAGNVIVGGYSFKMGTSWDFAVVKYISETGIVTGGTIGNTEVRVYPNPSSSVVSLEFHLDTAASCSATVYDIDGRAVESLFSGPLPQGVNIITWGAEGMPVGVYFLRLSTDETTRTASVLIL